MSDSQLECSCIIDVSGLHALANSSSNLKSIIFYHMKAGTIGVPSCVWQLFAELYEEEAAEIEPYVTLKIRMTRAYRVEAARIADNLNSSFSRGAYDDHTDLFAAAIASVENYRILTSSAQVKEYDGMGCEVVELESWVEELGVHRGALADYPPHSSP